MKKAMGLILALIIFIGGHDSMIINVNAAEFSNPANSPDDKFVVSYDSKKYKIYWVGRKTITFRSQYGSMWRNLDEDDKLGTATIRTYYLEPKKAVNKKYYAIAGSQVSMDPIDVAGDVTGMSQMADIRIKTINADSRVCSPTVQILNIQASNTNSKSSNFTAGTGVTYKTGTKSWEATGKFDFSSSWGSSSTYTYNMTNVNLTQKNKNGAYASWRYDYKSKDENVTWNAYLMSSSKVAGQVVYRLEEAPTEDNRASCIPTSIYYDIRFGAGDSVTGEVANRLGPSTNRDMSIKKDSITLSY